jgi:transcriptional regulator with XRE-family HTH domain
MASHGRKTPLDPNLGLRIELARRRAGLTQEGLGQALGVGGAAISHWESGRFAPQSDKIVALAPLLKTTVGWLTGEVAIGAGVDPELEALLLTLMIDGGERLQGLLEQFPDAQALIEYLASYEAVKPK